ncbi:MAG: response regulator [Candidatus Doudnabacteria bacterium]|nr:response regulator [Candidatus Doudnabacteria bacterium]
MIVENDSIWQKILVGWFSGHEVIGTAANEADALKLLREGRPELVTMDGNLDNEGLGLSIAGKMREQDPGVTIVMITGNPDLKFEGRGICKADFADYDVEACLKTWLAN